MWTPHTQGLKGRPGEHGGDRPRKREFWTGRIKVRYKSITKPKAWQVTRADMDSQ